MIKRRKDKNVIELSQYVYKAPENSSSTKKPKVISPILKELVFLTIKVAVIVVVFLIVFTFIYGFHYNVDPTMNPLVRDGDLIIYSRIAKEYFAKDLVVFEYRGQKQIRRVVAIAGDTVDIKEEGIYINGIHPQENDIFVPTEQYLEGITFPIVLEEGEVFLLGDTRNKATDSRIYGPINIKYLKGKVVTLIRRRNL